MADFSFSCVFISRQAYEMSPTTSHVSVKYLIAVADEYLALSTGAVATAPVEFNVTPPAATIAVEGCAPIHARPTCAPIGIGIVAFNGRVTVTAPALLRVTKAPSSDAARV